MFDIMFSYAAKLTLGHEAFPTLFLYAVQCGDWKWGGGGFHKSKWICDGEPLMREERQCFSGHYKTNVLMVLHQLVLTQKQEYSLQSRDTLYLQQI